MLRAARRTSTWDTRIARSLGYHERVTIKEHDASRSPLGGKATAPPDTLAPGLDIVADPFVAKGIGSSVGAPPPTDHLAMISVELALLPAAHAGQAQLAVDPSSVVGTLGAQREATTDVIRHVAAQCACRCP